MHDETKSSDHSIVEHVFGSSANLPVPPLVGVSPSERDGARSPSLLSISQEPANDTGNAKRMLAHFGQDMIHVRDLGWHEWKGTHWEREGGDEFAKVCAQKTASRISLEADVIEPSKIERKAIEEGQLAAQELDSLKRKSDWSEADQQRANRLRNQIALGDFSTDAVKKRQGARKRFAIACGNSSKITGMLMQAIPHCTIMPAELDADPLCLNCLNGTLVFSRVDDLECPDPDVKRQKGLVELRHHDRKDLMTKCAPVEYSPDATCPRFLEFIEKFQPSADLRFFLQTFLGYALTGLTDEQNMVFSYGLGANGKSTLVDIVCRILGNYAQTLSFETLADDGFGRRGDQATPDLVRLPGARLVRASEPKRGAHLNEAMIKSLTGGEPMLVRDLHKKFFEFRPAFKLILSGNHKPEITGGDHGIWRRVCLLPWDVTIPKEKQRPFAEISAEFWDERSGILNWLLEGTKNYLTFGLKIPEEVVVATQDYREEMDPIQNFLRDCVIQDSTSKNDEVQAREMFLAFQEWCEVNAIRPWKENAFARALPQKGIKRMRRGVSFYCGVSLNPERPRSIYSSASRNDDVPLD